MVYDCAASSDEEDGGVWVYLGVRTYLVTEKQNSWRSCSRL